MRKLITVCLAVAVALVGFTSCNTGDDLTEAQAKKAYDVLAASSAASIGAVSMAEDANSRGVACNASWSGTGDLGGGTYEAKGSFNMSCGATITIKFDSSIVFDNVKVAYAYTDENSVAQSGYVTYNGGYGILFETKIGLTSASVKFVLDERGANGLTIKMDDETAAWDMDFAIKLTASSAYSAGASASAYEYSSRVNGFNFNASAETAFSFPGAISAAAIKGSK
jgi:hypothetical protein